MTAFSPPSPKFDDEDDGPAILGEYIFVTYNEGLFISSKGSVTTMGKDGTAIHQRPSMEFQTSRLCNGQHVRIEEARTVPWKDRPYGTSTQNKYATYIIEYAVYRALLNTAGSLVDGVSMCDDWVEILGR